MSPTTLVKTSGSSMLPLIREGSMVSLVDVPPEKIGPGDIAALRIDGELTLHRILAVAREGDRILLRQKGDSEPLSTWVWDDQYEGKADWMFTSTGRRRLDVDGRSFRLRLLTLMSRLEADLFELPRRLRGEKEGRGVPGGRWLYGAARLLTLPVKFLAGPFLLSVYSDASGGEPGAEERLLVRCVREAAGGDGREESPPWGRKADRHLLVNAASSQGVAPFLAIALTGGGVSHPESDELLADLKPLVHRTALRAMEARQTAAEIAAVLGGDGIDYAVIKGPALSMTLYRQESLRPVSDVDVLVRRRDRERAVAALEKAGYRQKSRGLTERLLGWGHFHYALHPRGKGRLTVELHWELVDRANLYRLPEEELFGNLTGVQSRTTGFTTLGDEDHFIYLCLHTAKHGLLNARGLRDEKPAEWFCLAGTGNRLIWFLDLQLFLNRKGDSLHWGSIGEKARRWNVMEDLTEALRIVRRLFPGMGAEEALARLKVKRRVKVRKRDRGRARHLSSRVSRPLLEKSMKMDERFLFRPARLLFAGRLFFPSREDLEGFYGEDRRLPVTVLRVVHPFVMTARLLGIGRG